MVWKLCLLQWLFSIYFSSTKNLYHLINKNLISRWYFYHALGSQRWLLMLSYDKMTIPKFTTIRSSKTRIISKSGLRGVRWWARQTIKAQEMKLNSRLFRRLPQLKLVQWLQQALPRILVLKTSSFRMKRSQVNWGLSFFYFNRTFLR